MVEYRCMDLPTGQAGMLGQLTGR